MANLAPLLDAAKHEAFERALVAAQQRASQARRRGAERERVAAELQAVIAVEALATMWREATP